MDLRFFKTKILLQSSGWIRDQRSGIHKKLVSDRGSGSTHSREILQLPPVHKFICCFRKFVLTLKVHTGKKLFTCTQCRRILDQMPKIFSFTVVYRFLSVFTMLGKCAKNIESTKTWKCRSFYIGPKQS
jgi:hypothetical protein